MGFLKNVNIFDLIRLIFQYRFYGYVVYPFRKMFNTLEAKNYL